MPLSKNESKILEDALRKAIPLAVREFNEVRLAFLRATSPLLFEPEMNISEMNTVYAKIMSSLVDAHLDKLIPEFVRSLRKGYDFVLKFSSGDIMGEEKMSFRPDVSSWTGNGFHKEPLHVLYKFSTESSTGKIDAAFVGFIELGEGCVSRWTDKTTSANISTLQINKLDEDKFVVAFGSIKVNQVNLKPILTPVVYEPYNPIHQAYLRFKAYLTANAFQ